MVLKKLMNRRGINGYQVQKWARLVQNAKKPSETWKSIAHHPLHKLSTQAWIIKQTRFSRLELIWNLAILCDLCILRVWTDAEKRSATYEGQGNNINRTSPNGDLMRRRHNSFSKNIYCDICNICKGDLV